MGDAEPKGKLKARLDLVATIVMIVAAGILIWKSLAPPAAPAAAPRAQVAIPTELQSLDDAASKGNPTARAAIIEYSDFQCPFCGKFSRDVFPEVDRAYIATGKVRMIFRQLPLSMHEHARGAAVGAICADQQGQFWKFHDVLFGHQLELDPDNMLKHAAAAGLDLDRYRACLGGPAINRVKADEQAASSIGIHVTPTFLLGSIEGTGLRVTKVFAGVPPFTDFQKALDSLLSK